MYRHWINNNNFCPNIYACYLFLSHHHDIIKLTSEISLPQIFCVCCSHNINLLFLFMAYRQIFNISNTRGVASGAEIEFIPVNIAQCLVFRYCFVENCLSCCYFSVGHCIVCPSLIYDF